MSKEEARDEARALRQGIDYHDYLYLVWKNHGTSLIFHLLKFPIFLMDHIREFNYCSGRYGNQGFLRCDYKNFFCSRRSPQ